jgi:hypothetical protein
MQVSQVWYGEQSTLAPDEPFELLEQPAAVRAAAPARAAARTFARACIDAIMVRPFRPRS